MKQTNHLSELFKRIDGGMIHVFAASALDCGFQSQSRQCKDYKIWHFMLLC